MGLVQMFTKEEEESTDEEGIPCTEREGKGGGGSL